MSKIEFKVKNFKSITDIQEMEIAAFVQFLQNIEDLKEHFKDSFTTMDVIVDIKVDVKTHKK